MGNTKTNRTPSAHRLATCPAEALKHYRAIRLRKERAAREAKVILADGTKVVNGVKLYPTWGNNGQRIWVSIPD